jgi:hypothetical protein
MLRALLEAEGWQEVGHWRFSQKPGPVLEAFRLLATLCGYRLGVGKFNQSGVRTIPVMDSRPTVTVNELTISSAGEMPAWCPQTSLHSWVCRHGDQITITGNTDLMSPSNRLRLKGAALDDTGQGIGCYGTRALT